MENLEQIVAQNISDLRKARKWTQAELAEKLGYSDKSVSKWERGEALPDMKVMTQLSELFGVSLDFFTTENAAAELPEFRDHKSQLGYRIGVELLAVCAVWLVALSIFLFNSTLQKLDSWMPLIWAFPVSSFVMILFSIRWRFRVCAIVFESLFCWTAIAATFAQVLISRSTSLWHLFLIGIPLQGAIFLLAQIQRQRNYR